MTDDTRYRRLSLVDEILKFINKGGGGGGGLNQSKSSIILKKSNFRFFLKQMSSSSFHMFIYAGSQQCDLRSIYTVTKT